MTHGNLFKGLPDSIPEELFETLLAGEHYKLERIVSLGQATPLGQWYDQEWSEWALLLRGNAGLLFEGEPQILEMHPGDFVHIPAHRRHRVEWTDPKERTLWLAFHYW